MLVIAGQDVAGVHIDQDVRHGVRDREGHGSRCRFGPLVVGSSEVGTTVVTTLVVTGLLVTGLVVTGLTAALLATSLRRAPSVAPWPWRNYLRPLVHPLRGRPPAFRLSGRSLAVPRCRPRPAARPRRGRLSLAARPIGTGAPADAGVSAAHGAVGAAA